MIPVRDTAPRSVRAGYLAGVLIMIVLAGWGAGELIRSTLQSSDLQLVRDLAEQRSPAVTEIAQALSWVGSGPGIGIVAMLLCGAFLLRADRRAAGAVAIAAVGAVAISNVDKLLVARPRPTVAHLVAATDSSFPSGHATLSAAFFLAVLIVFLSRRPGRAGAIAAIAATCLIVSGIALSRVYLGVHYPTDVAGGLVLGATWAIVVTLAVYPLAPALTRWTVVPAAAD